MTTNSQEMPAGLDKQDRLDDFLFHGVDYVYRRRKLFGALVVLILVLMAILWGVLHYQDLQNQKRNEALFTIEQALDQALLAQGQSLAGIIAQLDVYIKTYPASSQAGLAMVYRAKALHSEGKSEEAMAGLKEALTKLEKNSSFHLLATLYLANILRDQNKVEEAIRLLDQAGQGQMQDILLMELAECYMSLKQNDKAKQKLEAIITNYPQSPQANRASQLLERL